MREPGFPPPARPARRSFETSSRISRPAASRLALALGLAVLLPLALAVPSSAQTVTATITADNAYSFGFGTASGVSSLIGNVENTTAANIFSCASGPERYPNLANLPNGYLYIVAYSDDNTTQGVLAQFVASGKTVYSGGSGWEVYATGMDRDPGGGAPSVAQVNAEIAKANLGTGGAGSSRGWVGPNGGPANAGYVGTLAAGETNASAGGSFPQVCPASANPNAQNALNDAARWMWYNPSGLADPFSGSVAGEFLIFRLPFSEVVTPRRVTVNKDISNPTGQTATGVNILIAGHHSQFAHIYYGSTTSFTSTFVGPNTLLQWTGANIPPGGIVHVGFVLLETSVDILGLYMTANGVSIGCAHQCNSNLHIWGFGGDLTYTNSVTACESVPLYVRNLTVQYFDGEQDLALLNPQTELQPMHIDRIDIPPVLIQPGESAKVAIPAPPRGSNWAVLRYTVSASPTGPGTEDFVEVPVPPRPAVTGSCASSTTALCLNQGRFKVEVQWQIPSGATGAGQAVQLTADTGYFWFFGSDNLELVVKVLDGTAINQHYWVFYGALSNVQYRIVVTDTLRGTQRTYVNPSGTLASSADTSAFPQ